MSRTARVGMGTDAQRISGGPAPISPTARRTSCWPTSGRCSAGWSSTCSRVNEAVSVRYFRQTAGRWPGSRGAGAREMGALMGWRLQISHRTGFTYAGPVASSYNEARMSPSADGAAERARHPG